MCALLGSEHCGPSQAACKDLKTPALHGLCRGGLNFAIAVQIPLSPSVAFALGLSLSSVIFHLPEKHPAISLDCGEAVCLLPVRHCQLKGQGLSRPSRMRLES